MFSRLLGIGLDRRVLLPLLMLSGLAASLAMSALPKPSRLPSLVAEPSPNAKSAKTLPSTRPAPLPPSSPPPDPRPAAASAAPADGEDGRNAASCGEGMLLGEGAYWPALGHLGLSPRQGAWER